jgi:hypothetical protein
VPDPGLGEEGGDAGAAGANALGQGALRIELQLELTGEVELLEQFVLAHIGRDHLLDLPGLQQQAEAEAVHPAIVRDDGQVFHPRVPNGADEVLRNAGEAKAPGHDGHAVEEQPVESSRGVLVRLFSHEAPLSPERAG